MMYGPTFRVRFTAPFACFTNPHIRPNRLTYNIMTPSAAKGALRSCYWKPEFEWVIQGIGIMAPIKTEVVTTKELKNGTGRTLLTSVVLRDVDYVVDARIAVNPLRTGEPAKIIGETFRRLRKGESFCPPTMGRSNMLADWHLVEPEDAANCHPITMQIGSLLWDMVPRDIDQDDFDPVFFTAHVNNGYLSVPQTLWDTHKSQFFTARDKAHRRRT